MGCPCRQIRAAIEHVPGGKFLVGLLPALPPTEGLAMKMLAPVAGQSFHLAHGPFYRAAAERVIVVAAEDVAEMSRLGCVPAPGSEQGAAPVEPEAVKADAPVDPVAQAIMPKAEPGAEPEAVGFVEPAEHPVESTEQ
jgi:hypothetical protein